MCLQLYRILHLQHNADPREISTSGPQGCGKKMLHIICLLDNVRDHVNFMRQRKEFKYNYNTGLKCKALLLPYLSMVVLSDKISSIERSYENRYF